MKYLKRLTKKNLMDHVSINELTQCWEWKKSRNWKGYGTKRHNGRIQFAHRLVWEMFRGKIVSSGLLVCHKCDNPPCVNIDHLFLGTNSDNMQDSISKNRFKRAEGERCHTAKLKNEDIGVILKLRDGGMTIEKIAGLYSVANSTIHTIITGKTWKSVVGSSK